MINIDTESHLFIRNFVLFTVFLVFLVSTFSFVDARSFIVNNVSNPAQTPYFFVNGTTGFASIGTAVPTQLFDVRGNVNVSNELYLLNGTAVSPWLYNQTQAANASIFTFYDSRWSSTYNVSYHGSLNNASYLSTYNISYEGSLNNASYLSTYNVTYHGLINNASYLSTFNATYAAINSSANLIPVLNGSLFNGIWNISGTIIYPKSLSYNVGIGTASPNSIFEVRTNPSIDRYVQIGNGTGSADTFVVRADDNGATYIRLQNLDPTAVANHGIGIRAQFGTNGSDVPISAGGINWLKEQNWTEVTSTHDSYLTLTNIADGDLTERLRIDSDGNVGIGTSSPSQKLTVSGNISSSDSINATKLCFGTDCRNSWSAISGAAGNLSGSGTAGYIPQWQNASILNQSVIFQSANRIGIGTASPAHVLTVAGTFNVTGLSYFGANISLGGFRVTNLSDPQTNTDAATKNYVDTLISSVNGSSNTADDWNLTGNNLFPKSLSYNVGIGTSTANVSLQVVGPIVTNASVYQGAYTTDDGLVIYLPFSEGTGTTAYDKGKYGDEAIFNTGGTQPTWDNGPYGSAIAFDAKDAHLRLTPANNSLNFDTIFGPSTVEMWFKADSLSGTKTLFSDNCAEWSISHSSSTIRGTAFATVNGPSISTDRWYHAALTHEHPTAPDNSTQVNNTLIKFYVDGVLQGQTFYNASNGANGYHDAPYFIGGDNCTAGTYFNGSIDEVKIYNRALNAEEVRLQYLHGMQSQGYISADKFRIFNSTWSELLRVSPSGYFGIGTSSPGTFLDVAGNVSLNDTLYVTQTGRVGIGTQTPTQLFDVLGNVNVSNELYLLNGTAVSPWLYNQTQAANTSIFNIYDSRWSSTYNISYEGSLHNASYLSTYNVTYHGLINNASYLSTYNISYEGSLNNASYLSTYNISYHGSLNNASYLSTYNATYDAFNSSANLIPILNGSLFNGIWNISGVNVFPKSSSYEVGIGTANPTTALDINGTFNSQNVTGTLGLYLASDAQVGIGTSTPSAKLHIYNNIPGQENNMIYAQGNRDNNIYIWLQNLNDTTSGAYSGLFSDNVGNSGLYQINPLYGNRNLLTINASQSVLLQFNSSAMFRVVGNSTFSGNTYTFGDVGIGTSSPNDEVSLVKAVTGGDVALRIHNLDTNSASTASIKFGVTTNQGYNSSEIRSVRSPSNDLAFFTDGSEVMRLLGSGGNVGIGTSSPSQKLTVSGNISSSDSINATKLCFGTDCRNSWSAISGAAGNLSGSGTAGYIPQWQNASILNQSVIFQSANRIGIGTTSPTRTLDVRGDIYTNTSLTVNKYEIRQMDYAAGNFTSNSTWYRIANTSVFATGRFTLQMNGNNSMQHLVLLAHAGGWGTDSDIVVLENAHYTTGPIKKVRISTNSTIRNVVYLDIFLEQSQNIDQVLSALSVVVEQPRGAAGSALWTLVTAPETGSIDGGEDSVELDTSSSLKSAIQVGAGATSTLSFLGNNGSQTVPTYSFRENVDTGIFSPGDNQLAFTVGGSERVRINGTTGYLGIGTSTPTSLLDVRGNVSLNSSLYVTTAGNVGIGIITPSVKLEVNSTLRVYNGGSNTGMLELGAADARINFTSGDLSIFDYGSGRYYEGIRVDGSNNRTLLAVSVGNVGIGTSSPSQKLTVSGNISASDSINATKLCFGTDCRNSWSAISEAAGNLSGSGTAGYIPQWQNASILNQSVIFQSANRIGIGTASPTGILDINGTVGSLLTVRNNTNILMLLNGSTGNIGLWTATPTARVEIKSSATGQRYVQFGNGTSSNDVLVVRGDDNGASVVRLQNLDTAALINHGIGIRFQLSDNVTSNVRSGGALELLKEQTWSGTSSTWDSYMKFSTVRDGSLVERMRVTSDGLNVSNLLFVNGSAVGIRTSLPQGALHVNGSTYITNGSLIITNTGDDVPFNVSGQFGDLIYRADRSSLRGGGAVLDTGVGGYYSMAYGQGADVDGQYYGIALGRYAYSNSFSSATAIGEYVNATADNSLAIGYTSVASASSAVSIGTGSVASGSNSIAIGSNTGSDLTTASNLGSIAIGSGATSGSLLATAIGTYALASGGDSAFALGNFVNATNLNSFAIGNNIASTTAGSFAIGSGFTNANSASMMIGISNPLLYLNSTNVGLGKSPSQADSGAVVTVNATGGNFVIIL